LREAACSVRLIESTVATFEDIHFGIVELWVAVGVQLSVLVTYELCPKQD
jgi:hypothetical protein